MKQFKVTKVDLKNAKRDYEKKVAELLGKDFKTDRRKSNAERRRELRKEIRAKSAKKPKFNNEIVEYKGRTFHSKLEANDYKTLFLKQESGEITGLKCQDTILLSEAGIKNIVDFSYTIVATGERVWWETKGYETETYLLKKKLWKTFGPGRLFIHYGKGKIEEVIPKYKRIPCKLCGK